ncbi:hypothetical protein GUJ93_ZPchr0006g42510 [Zizania palustris]|uniref:Uncharacterized protein n=1 Tax=Zizania palustris TaxID=103762 RepID=A0A8J5S8X1_ZIZPA|nr:hypothetical protein GUJ93_ZPchr0006g42510 [Zizania palustris]
MKMVQDSNPAQDMINITGHVVHEDVSYDKDVLEIKFPDTSDYGGNFVKDVGIDEGAFSHREIPKEKMLDGNPYPKFDFVMIDASGDLRYGGKGDARRYAHQLKPETVLLPVGLAADDNTVKQYDLATNFAGDISEKKISLKELFKLESAQESLQRLEPESAEELGQNHMPTLHGEAVGQVEAASENDELVTGGLASNDNVSVSSATISDRHDATAALEKLIPTAEPEITDSLSGSREVNEAGAAEARPDALTSSSSSGVQPSEESNDRHESFVREEITSAPDVHDFNQTDEENRADATTDEKIGTSSTEEQKGSAHVGGQDLHENEKGKSRIGNGHLLDPCSFGPSIMCNPVSASGHIANPGNVSVRSDSSTTSTRSFAFPVQVSHTHPLCHVTTTNLCS